MEKSCEHCNELFIGKRSDSVYCSSSCRQMAYMERRLNPFPNDVLNRMKNEESFPTGKTSIDLSPQNQEPSIDSSLKNDPSINASEKNQEPSIDGYTNDNETATGRLQRNKKPSIDSLEFNLKAPHQTPIDIKSTQHTANDSVTDLTSDEANTPYESVNSNFLTAIADLSNRRNHLSVLNNYLYYYKNAASYEVGLRLKCLIECLLTFSEMNLTELENLKEVCNAFTLTIGSNYYKRLPEKFPYKSYILLLRDKLKQLIIENRSAENLRFKISPENKIELLATRFELSEFYTKTRFCDINFSE